MEVKAVRNVVSGDRHKLPQPIRKTRLPEVRKCMCFQNSLSTRSTFFAILSKRNDFQNFCNQHSVLTLHMFFSSFAEWCHGTKNIFKKKKKKKTMHVYYWAISFSQATIIIFFFFLVLF